MKASPLYMALALTLGGCGLAYTVPRDQLRDLTIEQKLLLFDAQNEAAIAVDEREEARRAVVELRRDLEELHDQIVVAKNAIDAAGDDAKAERIAELNRDVLELKREYFETKLRLAREKLDVQDELVRVAEAKFELAKAKLVKRNKLRGAADIEIADFDEQVDTCVAQARDRQEELAPYIEETEQARKAWQSRRQQLREASGDALGNPWVDDASATDGW